MPLIQSCCELRRLQEIPLPGPCRKSNCLGPAGNPMTWALQEIQLPRPCTKSHCLGPAGNLIASGLHEIPLPRACRCNAKVAILVSSSLQFKGKCFARQTLCFMPRVRQITSSCLIFSDSFATLRVARPAIFARGDVLPCSTRHKFFVNGKMSNRCEFNFIRRVALSFSTCVSFCQVMFL